MGKGDFYDDDLNTTLVRNKLAAYKCCRNYSAPRYLSLVGDLKAKYLNVENGIIYGLPNVFEAWHLACQKYLEKVPLFFLILMKYFILSFVVIFLV